MTLHERTLAFQAAFPNPASWLWVTREQDRDVLYGIWVIGALYANQTAYYGAFPRTFLDRLMALFPDMHPSDILHVFSGSLPAGLYTRVDCNPLLEPDVVGDVLEVKALFQDRAPFGLVIADPPYSDDDAKKYAVVMIDRGKVTRALADVVRPGGYLAWIDWGTIYLTPVPISVHNRLMSKSTISTFQLFKAFPDQESARVYFEQRLWPNGVVCPVCKAGERITVRKGGYYRCNACQEDFTVRTGTVMERSHIPLHKWLYAMYLLVTARKGISSLQLAKQIGVTQKSAWFMLHRLREACGGRNLRKLKGIIEIDETFVGGLEGNKHANKKLHAGRGPVGKTAVLGMKERGGRMQARPSGQMTFDEVHGEIHRNVEPGSQLYTDDSMIFEGLDGLFFRHDTINHSLGEYARGAAHTNSIESVWAVLKRGLMGVYHQVSAKHLPRYVDEFTFRLNEGNVKIHTLDRLDSFVDGMADKRLTYARLVQ